MNPYATPAALSGPAPSLWDRRFAFFKRAALVLFLCSIPANALLWRYYVQPSKIADLSPTQQVVRFFSGWTYDKSEGDSISRLP